MNKRASSTKIRRACFDRHKWTDALGKIWLTCHICGLPIDPARERWEAEHVIRRVLTKSDDPDGIMPAHPDDCHSEKTKVDNRDNNHGKRVHERHYGIRAAKGRPMPGSKRSSWRHRMDGTWEKRS